MSTVASLSEIPRHRQLGLTDHEYELILERLGREPNTVELAMLSLMWSEHCAYKHSRKLLRRLPTTGPHLLLGPGENAGAVDVGGGLALAFKVESHNHPSAVEPFQGAATGVGGILRDIFAVGARPIAVLDSLRFGEPEQSERSRYLLGRAVAGIGHYGNSIGVPTIGGEVYFEPSYEQNCLVNAMCLGIAPRERLIRSAAAGPGNLVVLLGALTGRDGIGGASVLASAELGEGDEAKRPSVQIGDPFAEKKLLECCLELLDRGLLVALQDLGAAGLTSSVSEMVSKGGVGVELNVSRVPVRDSAMEPFEIMVSESQERMLCVVEPPRLHEVLAICRRWETLATAIGEVTDSGHVRVLDDGEPVADLPVHVLVDDCPLYDLKPAPPSAPPRGPEGFETPRAGGRRSEADLLLALLGSPNICSRRPLFEQYDWIVQSRTVRRPEQTDAAVLALPDGSGIAVSIDGNGRRVYADPRLGAAEAVYECAANLACVGAEPLGVTNCLNFGNPEKPTVAWQLTEAVEGVVSACEALGIPVVGGNVSLYNEAPAGPIFPTPVIGIVGKLPDVARAGRLGFAREGDAIALVGPFSPSLAASELEKLWGRTPSGPLPDADGGLIRQVHATIRGGVRRQALRSAHDVAEGGVAVALAECCIAGGIGARVELPDALDSFGEAPGRGFIVSGPADALERWADSGPSGACTMIGKVCGDALQISSRLSLPVDELARAWGQGLDKFF
ncbi:MAG TPA: phosphoribosylformylglycinamidine synthase subunit PurL [Solirubrobacteraceae bacterium]|nr:phosphoribosylformylglycinamidine synthase subunit PurL [Solirubrobacteraceae bacterium]